MPNQSRSNRLNASVNPRLTLQRLLLLLLVAGSVVVFRPAHKAAAQEVRCFSDVEPAISACIAGRFRTFWEQHDGLSVFGYPLTEATQQTTSDGTYLIQYFERARFELHPEQEPPYDVLLGRLGVELAANQATPAAPLPPPADAECQFWTETQQTVCEPFLSAWRTAGLQLDGDPGLNDAERLALWGLPVSGVLAAPPSASGVVRIQWFERARFEQQADGSITIGQVGREMLRAGAQTPIEPTSTPLPEPSPVAPAEPSPVPPPPAPPVPPAPSVAFPSAPCNTNVPNPVEGIQVWMTDSNPLRETDAVACVRLIVNGVAVNGAPAMAYRYLGDERRPSIPQSTGLDGVASFIFYIGELGEGQRVPVEATATYRGITYVAYTEFVAR